MSLNLDDRQRAMLAEMGVRVWWPTEAVELAAALGAPEIDEGPPWDWAEDAVAGAAEALPMVPEPMPVLRASTVGEAAAAPKLPPAVAVAPPTPDRLLPLPDGIAALDWDSLQRSVAQCQACAMCLGRRTPVLATGAHRADWLIVGEPPDEAQERAGAPFVGDAGQLLDNMLKAVGVRRWLAADGADSAVSDPSNRAHLSLVLKCRPALPTAPDAQALAACAHYLRREIALVQPRVIVAMGRLAMQVLLGEAHPQGIQLPLGKLRGQVWRYQDVPVVVSYPPTYLLRQGQDKGRAWEDLCLARAVALGTR